MKFSPELVNWLHSFSQSAASDMCEGGDDAECVAETCLTCVDVHDRKLAEEVRTQCEKHGYRPVLREAMKHVCTGERDMRRDTDMESEVHSQLDQAAENDYDQVKNDPVIVARDLVDCGAIEVPDNTDAVAFAETLVPWVKTWQENKRAACQHRNDGRGCCPDCGAFL